MAQHRGKKKDSANEDVVLVHGVTEDGEGYRVVRKRDDRIELGAVRPLAEGRPITGEVVRLVRRTESPLLFDVETTYAATRDGASESTLASGPARVSNDDYRKGWTKVWGRPSRDRSLN